MARVFSRLGNGKGKSITLKGIERKHKCSMCGKEGKTHFHHRCKKPDDVVELCPDCHYIRHQIPRLIRKLL